VCFQGRIDYLVIDLNEAGAPEIELLDGETGDLELVVREVVKRYVDA
jgi:hypothetical protein